ncbi:hypothetical protein ATANTOWER_022060 [Ataeniobius toweri]|uniref:Uncharacterized protein n=1 Tax=Ataeniobius toweri TaxID=208326 RepID=A0ABU7AGW5_9TELE|nr:hypothetical protein [Ataeniobius toweri]
MTYNNNTSSMLRHYRVKHENTQPPATNQGSRKQELDEALVDFIVKDSQPFSWTGRVMAQSTAHRYDWQLLLHRCFSSESNQLGFLWSGNPEGGVSSFSHSACSTFAEGSCGIPLVSVFTCVMFRGVWKLQPRCLHSASNSKPSFSGVS